MSRRSLPYPEWIKALGEAAENLARAVRETPFPDLAKTPATNDEVERIVGEAASWGAAVRKAYGEDRSYRHDGKGVLPLLRDGCEGFIEPNQPGPGNPPPGGKQLFYFETAFFRAPGVLGAGRSIRDPRERRIAFTRESWDEIRKVLDKGRVIVTDQANILVEWVRNEIRRLTGQPGSSLKDMMRLAQSELPMEPNRQRKPLSPEALKMASILCKLPEAKALSSSNLAYRLKVNADRVKRDLRAELKPWGLESTSRGYRIPPNRRPELLAFLSVEEPD